MPKRTDIHKILIVGSGPTVIGQGGEFDYAAVQACKALREEGYETVIVNSDPASLSTAPGIADRAYIEPLTVDSLTEIIAQERPDALLPTVGGQTALNLSTFLEREGVLARFGVTLIGASATAIARVQDGQLFKETMLGVGVQVPKSGIASSIEQGLQVISEIGFPVILPPAYTTGGAGSAIAYNREEYMRMLALALETSPIHRTLIEESLSGWKEIEFEVVRDSQDGFIAVTSLESIDPMGVHSGDSTVVVPAQTFTTSQIARLVDLSKKVVSAIDVIGGAGIRYAVNPESSDAVIIAVNPRASRGSALASKATGFPIACVAAKLAVGLTLDEIKGDISEYETAPSCCVVKLPRFDFGKFPGADEVLDTSMKSVGEAMSIGTTFKEALQKGIRSLEIGRYGLGADGKELCDKERQDVDLIRQKLSQPNADRLFFVRCAIENGMSTSDIQRFSRIDPWFIESIRELVEFEKNLAGQSIVSVPAATIREAKQLGYSDVQLASLLETTEEQVRQRRKVLGIESSFGKVAAKRPYFYSTYAAVDRAPALAHGKTVVILGSGPNRIGSGIELDYCCAQAAEALREEGYESVIINCNPEAVSTDFDTSDRLYFDPLTREDVLGVIDREQPMGVIAQLGGRTSRGLGMPLKAAGVPILGTSPDTVARAADRRTFGKLVSKLGLKQTDFAVVTSLEEALAKAAKIGYPVLVRPSCVGCDCAMEIVYDAEDLAGFVEAHISAGCSVLIEKFIEDAVGVDVDAISDGKLTLVCGVMERIEQAGVHPGDSACSLPPFSLPEDVVAEVKRQVKLIAEELDVRGLINIAFAVKDGAVYVLEANPYASQTVPFVSKATGVAWAKVATKILLGKSLEEQGITREIAPAQVSVKEAVFPFVRFPGVDVVLGPEMKSTGEVMGIDTSFGNAYMKAQIAAGQNLPQSGTVFMSVVHRDKADIGEIARGLSGLGFTIAATRGTAEAIAESGVQARIISKIGEGRPDATDLIKNNEVALIINTPSGKKPRRHEVTIRSAVVASGIPIITTIAGAKATVHGLKAAKEHGPSVRSVG